MIESNSALKSLNHIRQAMQIPHHEKQLTQTEENKARKSVTKGRYSNIVTKKATEMQELDKEWIKKANPEFVRRSLEREERRDEMFKKRLLTQKVNAVKAEYEAGVKDGTKLSPELR